MNTLIPVTRMLNAALNGDLDPWGDMESVARWTPRADILEGEKEYRITMDLPGVKTEDLEIHLEKQTLGIATKQENDVPEGFKTLRRERPGRSTFSRSFKLGVSVDEDKVSAKLERGVLTISLPKSVQSLPRRIDVVQEG
jgi:HSP20 family protein